MSLKTGKMELTLTYGQQGGLGRTTEPQEYSVLIQRMDSCYSLIVTPLETGVALLKTPDLSRVRIKQSDGTVIEGTVRSVKHNYFELIEEQRSK